MADLPEKALIIDAIDFVGMNKFHYLVLLCCFGVHFSAIVQIVVVSYVMRSAAEEFIMTSIEQGVLGGMAFFGMVVGAFFWGVAMDVGGRRLTLSVALTCEAFTGALSSTAATDEFLSFSRFFIGFFIQGSVTSSLTYLGETLPTTRRSKGIIIFGAAPGVSNLVTAGIAWMVHGLVWRIDLPRGFVFDSWRILLVFTAIPPLILLTAFHFLPESPMYLVRRRRPDEALAVMQRVWSYGSKLPPSKFPIKEILLPPEQTSRSFLHSALFQVHVVFMRESLPKTIFLCFISFSVITGYNGTLIWVPEIVGRIQDYEKQHPGQLLSTCEVMLKCVDCTQDNSGSVFENYRDEFPEHVDPETYMFAMIIGACILVMSVLGYFIVVLLGNKFTLIILLFVNGCLCIGVAYIPGGLTGYATLMTILVPFGVLSLAAYSTLTLELYDTETRGMAINIVMMFGRMGSLVSNLIFGLLIDRRCQICFLYVAAILFISGVFAVFLPRNRETRPHVVSYLESAMDRAREHRRQRKGINENNK